ncbi:hypothetical protein AGMMS50268_22240 [Spirochaetia bacterium]|nr:hypothetical protein AGMMS50268_22240 [Spirochaetia bacterium]
MRDTADALHVNYLEMEIRHRETGKITYKNSWVTDKPITKENTACARARWKIENEHNSATALPHVLKNHGYNLEHNAETTFPSGTGTIMQGEIFAF